MKAVIRRADERGGGDFEWLSTRHSFSFGDYYDPGNMGFGVLRVLNDDTIIAGAGFPPHGHRDMEIFTIPLSGSLSHKDSTGTSSTISPGDIQIMSAGTGVTHSEFNASENESLTLLQIWIVPHTKNLTPRYEEKYFPFLTEKGKLHTVINPTGKGGALRIFQDAYISIGSFSEENHFNYALNKKGNGLFVFVIEGGLNAENNVLGRRDTLEVTETDNIQLSVEKDSLILLIEVPLK